MATPAELQAKLEREKLELNALRKKVSAAPPGPQRDALLEQERILEDSQFLTTRQINIASGDPARNTAIAVYDGVDENSGEFRYRNLVTGDTFLSQTRPTDGQIRRGQAPNLPPPAVVPPLPTVTQPETAPAEVQTPAIPPQLVEIVEPAPVAEPDQVAALSSEQIAVLNPAPLPPVVPADVNPFPPVVNVIVEPPPVPVDQETVPDSANQSSSYTGAPAPVSISPFGGGAFNDAAARNPDAVADAVAAADAAQQAATERRLREQQAIQAQFQSPANGDWRVKLKLAPQATYLYKDTSNKLLQPLAASDGVVFPYMPEIQTSYNANYDTTDLTHSNYRGQFYKSSYVGDISITGTFTAQNTFEANYLLAVIHFFRSATKMFYGSQDSQRGTPPPLVYLFGLGQYQFNAHPCVIRSFSYNLPNTVDYIKTKPNNYNANFNNELPKTQSGGNTISAVFNRLRNALLPKGALPNVPQELLTVSQSVTNLDNATYVPTRIDVTISLLPIQTRNQQSQQFSVKEFASGDLLKGGFW